MLKNLLLVFVALLCLYMYLHPRTETQVIAQTAAPVKAFVPPPPAPTPVPKVYYHSPLDASAMSTSANSGMGYFSTDHVSRFNSGYNGSYGPSNGSYQAAAPPVYYSGGGSSTVTNTVIYNVRPGVTAQPTPVNRAYVSGRLPNR